MGRRRREHAIRNASNVAGVGDQILCSELSIISRALDLGGDEVLMVRISARAGLVT